MSFLVLLILLTALAAAQQRELRVCADGNNLPFSNKAQQGFENKLAELLAQQMNAKLTYSWVRENSKFVQRSLLMGTCDVVLGLPTGFPKVLLTQPYYTCTWVFVTRKDKHLNVRSFDSPQLRNAKIGLHKITDDQDTPAYYVLQDRGLNKNIVWFTINQNYSRENPPAELIEAVESGKVDVGIVWGPLAGYFAQKSPVPLEITPVLQPRDHPDLPFTYSIAMAVRRDRPALKAELDRILAAHRSDVQRILTEYGVPRLRDHALTAAKSGNRKRQGD